MSVHDAHNSGDLLFPDGERVCSAVRGASINCVHAVDAITGLDRLPDGLVDRVPTLPPCWRVRDSGSLPARLRDGRDSILGVEHNIPTLAISSIVAHELSPGNCRVITAQGSGTVHTAPFPEAPFGRPIPAGCPLGGMGLDPFIDDGSTALTAAQLGRWFKGFEANSRFADVARRRLNEHFVEHLDLNGGADSPAVAC